MSASTLCGVADPNRQFNEGGAMSSTPAVELRGIGKRFPGVMRITTLTSTFEPELFTPSSVKMELEINPDEDALRNARA